jgi:hypothetical protein
LRPPSAMFPSPTRPRVRFDATLASVVLEARFRARLEVDPTSRAMETPRLSFAALQHSQIQEPLFSLLVREASGALCSASRKTRPQGLATLSAARAPEFPEAFFSFRRSWASPFRAFLLPGDRPGLSTGPSAPALSPETSSALGRRFDGLIPPRKPYPFAQPDRLNPVGALALLGFRASQVFLPLSGSDGRLSRRMSLPVLASVTPRGTRSPHPQGVSRGRLGISPYGTPACLAFRPTALAVSSKP